ncbi:hypothetical protein PsorP6_010648 [Peronosclerospora sorghi]|uniref:Uncharacterized protein n=1 Tax=Peronosclerospora sorghi TaxID=230839 RepID=A0ACC0VVE8_9STRA|nr:hypothetical protein PsorP6_010648 [Peronosclerospora sorghi]
MAIDDTLSCPVCFEVFSLSAGASFALHVASCSSVSPPTSPSSSSSVVGQCPRCLHVYAAGSLAHEISFHEHECARVNDLPDEDTDEEADGASSTGRKTKRQRNGAERGGAAARHMSLFPSNCFLCHNSGRGLLRCNGSCARVVHQHCIDQLQAPMTGDPLSFTERKQAADQWMCAQCLRGIHRCQRCGFLGHKANGMRKCAVLDCGIHFHEHCRMETQDGTETDFVCPRHTCTACGTQETDMRRCKSCSLCFHMTHLRCPRGSSATVAASSGLEPMHLFECSRHDEETTTSLASSPDATNSLRLRFAPGDVVLVLEFDNALLPATIKTVAPDAANHWGIVLTVEHTEPRTNGNQLLKVRMFADENLLVVPNQYALRVTNASDFSKPVDLVRHCLQRHAMVELQLRHMERKVDDAEATRILLISNSAFTARLTALKITAADAASDAQEGFRRWRHFQESTEPYYYDGLGDAAPCYLFIDTRGSRSGRQISNHTNVANVMAEVDGDVPMTDANSGSGKPPTNESTSGSPLSRPPKRCGKSPHEAETGQPVEADGMSSAADLGQSSWNTPPCEQFHKDVIMTDTHVTQSGSSKRSWPVDLAQSQSISTGVELPNTGGKRVLDIMKCADVDNVKRPKLNFWTPIRISMTPFTPSKTHRIYPGASPDNTTTPSLLHISPMALSMRTWLSPKRKKLARKQKVLAGMPTLVLEELKREALEFLEQTHKSRSEVARIPADRGSFPWAAQASNFHPAFYQPTAMLDHSGLRGGGIDTISHLLVCQDKRSIKCYVHTDDNMADMPWCGQDWLRRIRAMVGTISGRNLVERNVGWRSNDATRGSIDLIFRCFIARLMALDVVLI